MPNVAPCRRRGAGKSAGGSQLVLRLATHAGAIEFTTDSQTESENNMTPTRKIGLGGFLLGSIVAGTISVATLGSASAAPAAVDTTVDTTVDTATDSGDSTTATDTDPDTNHDTDREPAGPHTANGITEEVLTGETATSVEAAVIAVYPDATIERMETDAEGAAYEAHVTLADGSRATVKLDAAFAITATETGGGGGRGGHGGGRGGGGPHTANGITEEALTGDTATSVEAAVVAAYPDATIDRMETDADGATYEAHITLADGTHTTVLLDDAFAITGTDAD
jgi:hypothetical protein